jgi:hypothetical protein
MPVNMKHIPYSMARAQPPIPTIPGHRKALEAALEGEKVDEYDTDSRKSKAVIAGAEMWKVFDIAISTPRARGCWVEMHEKGDREEGEKWFPQGLGTWRVGAWFEDVSWILGDVTEWKL